MKFDVIYDTYLFMTVYCRIYYHKFLMLYNHVLCYLSNFGGQWLSGRVLDWRPRGCGYEPHGHHCVVSLSKKINPSLVFVQPRKTDSFIAERLLIGCEESNQTNKANTPVISQL